MSVSVIANSTHIGVTATSVVALMSSTSPVCNTVSGMTLNTPGASVVTTTNALETNV